MKNRLASRLCQALKASSLPQRHRRAQGWPCGFCHVKKPVTFWQLSHFLRDEQKLYQRPLSRWFYLSAWMQGEGKVRVRAMGLFVRDAGREPKVDGIARCSKYGLVARQ